MKTAITGQVSVLTQEETRGDEVSYDIILSADFRINVWGFHTHSSLGKSEDLRCTYFFFSDKIYLFWMATHPTSPCLSMQKNATQGSSQRQREVLVYSQNKSLAGKAGRNCPHCAESMLRTMLLSFLLGKWSQRSRGHGLLLLSKRSTLAAAVSAIKLYQSQNNFSSEDPMWPPFSSSKPQPPQPS